MSAAPRAGSRRSRSPPGSSWVMPATPVRCLRFRPVTRPLAALERACLPALRRGRCCVSFSGGRDSSIVLAAATRVARREGLALPTPVTNRFPHAGPTDESEWQELVVRHLGLDDWLRIDHTDALDIVGPVARQVLERHGLLWPFNAHFHVPLLEAAEGGALLTGIGGDELFRERPLGARRVGAAPEGVSAPARPGQDRAASKPAPAAARRHRAPLPQGPLPMAHCACEARARRCVGSR